MVGSGELIDKPIALINASARAILDASITIPLEGKTLDANGIVENAGLSAALRRGWDRSTRRCRTREAPLTSLEVLSVPAR